MGNQKSPLKILVCGMPRSMTTWIFNVVDILSAQRLKKYWIEPDANSEDRYVKSKVAALGKCHFYSDTLASSSDITIYSYRDLRIAAVSALRKFSPGDMDLLVNDWIAASQNWITRADLNLCYEDIAKSPNIAIDQIRTLLQKKNIKLKTITNQEIASLVEKRFSGVSSFNKETMVHPEHRTLTPNIKKMSSHELKLYKFIEQKHSTWLDDFGYIKKTSINKNLVTDGDILKTLDLRAKEAVIQELRTAYENAQKTNEELERSRTALIEDISSVKQLLSAAEAKNETGLSAKEAVIQELRTAYESAQKTNEELECSLVLELEKNLEQKITFQFQEAQLLELKSLKEELTLKSRELSFIVDSKNIIESNELLKSTVRALEDKEKVINELSAALNAYREAYERLNFFKKRVNKLFQLDEIKNGVHNFFRPKIGNLNQHKPRIIKLSGSYFKKRSLIKTPKLSIVTPSFNQGHFIGRTIDSILGQNYENLEYIIQDGGSRDSTVNVIKEYESLHDIAWESVKDNGQSHALNLGFKKCSGDILAWVNSDDVLLPGAIEAVISYFNKHPDVDVVYGNRLLIDEADLMIGRWILPGHDNEVLSWADYVPQETMFFRRTIWEACGGQIDEEFRFAMDWDLILRFRDAGAKFAHLSRYIGGFRIHESQKTSAQIDEVGMKEMNLLRERCVGHIPNHIEITKNITPFLIKHKIKHAHLTFNEFIRRRL